MSKPLHRIAAAIFTAVAAGVLAGTGAGGALAQGFPNKPVRIVVPFAAGGAVDTVSRIIGQKAGESWKQPVIVDNRPGAGGNIGADVVAKAPPDGYTVLVTTHGHAISPGLYRRLPFDALQDFAPIAQLTSSYLVLTASQALPAASLRDMITLAKARPGKLNYGSTGLGAPPHLVMELLKIVEGVDVVHVPYKGDAPLMAALLAGEVHLAFMPLSGVLPQIRSGKLRAIGMTSPTRAQAIADVPTMIEAGVRDFEFSGWLGMFAPAATPREVQTQISAEMARIFGLADVRERLPAMGYQPVGSTPEEFTAKYRADVAKNAKVIKEAGIPLVD